MRGIETSYTTCRFPRPYSSFSGARLLLLKIHRVAGKQLYSPKERRGTNSAKQRVEGDDLISNRVSLDRGFFH